MGHLGVRVVRIYTIHPPAFYAELRRLQPGAPRGRPLYLVQGVYPPTSRTADSGDLFAAGPTDGLPAGTARTPSARSTAT